MKKTAKYILGIVLALGFTQCSLDTDLYQDINTEEAFNGVQDVQNAMNGAYERFGSYYFYGNYAVATSDFISDISLASTSSGHFVAINQWSFDEYNTELTDMWSNGYKTLDRCVRGINGGKALLADSVSSEDSLLLNSYISQMYALRAMTSLVLVNYFGLPYDATNTTDLGIVLIKDKPIKEFEQVSRATVHETYAQILSDIAAAKAHMALLTKKARKAINQFYFNEAAIYALEARTKLYMKDYDGAKVAAQQAIDLRASGDETIESYVSMWKSTAITKEDIFTIAKSDNDNLSSNALNTLYGSYGSSISSSVTDIMQASDIRSALIDEEAHPKKFDGTATSAAVSNIPVFRKSEMYLILAEANIKGTTQDLDAAKEALLFTAKRDTASFKTVADLPATAANLTKMVMDERVREFFCEGHRYFDLRRTGTIASLFGSDYDFSKWVFPIPGNEVDAGFGVVQNTNWSAARPQ